MLKCVEVWDKNATIFRDVVHEWSMTATWEARFSLKTHEFGEWLLPGFVASAPGFGSLNLFEIF